VIGIRPVYAKLTAFAVSSFIVGVAGALWGFIYLGSWEPAAFSIDRSFQLMFAAITPALITGAFAERKRFGSFVLFTILWSILIYSPIAHWVWSTDGWLFKLGALDFAGGTVVHISSGVSALVAAMVLGLVVPLINFALVGPRLLPLELAAS